MSSAWRSVPSEPAPPAAPAYDPNGSPKRPTSIGRYKYAPRAPTRRQSDDEAKSANLCGFGDFTWEVQPPSTSSALAGAAPGLTPKPPAASSPPPLHGWSHSSEGRPRPQPPGPGASPSPATHPPPSLNSPLVPLQQVPPHNAPSGGSGRPSTQVRWLEDPSPSGAASASTVAAPPGGGFLVPPKSDALSASGNRKSLGGSQRLSSSAVKDRSFREEELSAAPKPPAQEEIEYEILSFGDVVYKVPKRKQQHAAVGGSSPGSAGTQDPKFRHRQSLVSAMVDELDINVLAKGLNAKEEDHLLDQDGMAGQQTDSLGGSDTEDDENLEAELTSASTVEFTPLSVTELSARRPSANDEANPATFFGDFCLTDEGESPVATTARTAVSTQRKSNLGLSKSLGDSPSGGAGFAFGDFGASDANSHKPKGGMKSASQSFRLQSFDVSPILRWDVAHWIGHRGRVRGVVSCDSSDAHLISTGGDEKKVTARKQGFDHLASNYSPHRDIVLHIAISSDGRFLATCGNDDCLCVHDNQTSKRIAVMKHPEAVTCCAFADNGRFIISGCHDGICRLYSVQGAGPLRAVNFSKDCIVTTVALHPTGEFAASGSSDGDVFLWRSASGSLISMPREHTTKRQVILQVSFAKGGSFLATLDRQCLTFLKVPAGIAVFTIRSASIPCVHHRLRDAGGKKTRASSPVARETEFCFTAFHCGVNDGRHRSLPDTCIALAGNDREVRVFDFAALFEEIDEALRLAADPQTKKKSIDATTLSLTPSTLVPVPPTYLTPLLSFTTAAIPSCLSPGRNHSLLVGDVHGNVSVLHTMPAAGYKGQLSPSEVEKAVKAKRATKGVAPTEK